MGSMKGTVVGYCSCANEVKLEVRRCGCAVGVCVWSAYTTNLKTLFSVYTGVCVVNLYDV